MEGASTAGGGGGPAPFLLKTYDMVDDSATDEIVSWSTNKKSFIVWNPPEFARLLLPTYFKHNNFSSFIRQLNTYGFRKIDPERWEFANEDFIQDQKHLLKNIHRRKPIHSHSNPQGSMVDPERAALDDEIEKLSHDKATLEANISRFKQQRSDAKLQLEDLTQRVNSMEQRQKDLLKFLDKNVQNPTFVEHLTRKIEAMDFSACNKKRRLPDVDHLQPVVENSFVDNQSSSRSEFGNIFHQDFSSKLRLELSPAVSDINLVSRSTQSSNEDGYSPTRKISEELKGVQKRTEGLLFAPETLELSDTGTSFAFKMDSLLSRKALTAGNPRLHSLQPGLSSNEEGDGQISCQLKLTLASSPLQVNSSPHSATIPQVGQDISKSLASGLNAIGKESDIRAFTNKNPADEDMHKTCSQEATNNNQGPPPAPVRVNDVFWEQFLTERPGCSVQLEIGKMAKAAPTLFLEDWLRSVSGFSNSFSSRNYSASSARAIIQAWAELRDCLQHKSFQSHHLQSLKTLVNSQTSLHVAEPQAKLLLSILSSPDLSLPHESYTLFLRLLYIWVRKSARPSSVLIDSAVKAFSNVFSITQYNSKKSPHLFSEGVLLLGSLSFAPSVSESSKIVFLGLLCRLLAEEYQVLGSFSELIPDVLAGIGYALCSSVKVHFVTIFDFMLSIWGKESGPQGSVSHGLMILHLMEWVMSGLSSFRSLEKINTFSQEVLETAKANYVPFAVVMAAAGVLRALNRSVVSGLGLNTISRLRRSAEDRIESVARELISRTRGFTSSDNDRTDSLLLQCVSVALARSGVVSARSPLFICLASALLTEIFPSRRLYMKVLKSMHGSSAVLRINEVKEHLESLTFKEAGAITGVFCNLYVSVDEQSKHMVENLVWDHCQHIYMEHRQVALVLRGKEDEVLGDLEKIAESAFLMVVLFALAVTKHKLNSKFNQESQMDTSVRILISFSCLEYFRRIRLPEYMDTIRGIVVSVQESDSACVSFVRSIPTYVDLTNGPDFSFLRKMEYLWYNDEVQTARILFYLRVIPTCIARLPSPVFGKVVAPTMFLYMGHPNGKVARASHSMVSAFISSGKDSDQDERESLKEQLVFYYIQRSLVEYPEITPFEGMASGVAALVRHLPAGSPAIFYCIHCLVEKANRLCIEDLAHQDDMWKNWQGESEPGKKILDLLLRLISLVDIQVLPDLMKLLAQLIAQLPKDGQNMILNELYSQVAESDDVTRKPTLVSWLQSLSYLCFQETSGSAASRKVGSEANSTSVRTPDPLNDTSLNARL